MNRITFIEQQGRKQSWDTEHQIMDQYCINLRNADKSARDAKTNKMLGWVTACAAIAGLAIALLK